MVRCVKLALTTVFNAQLRLSVLSVTPDLFLTLIMESAKNSLKLLLEFSKWKINLAYVMEDV